MNREIMNEEIQRQIDLLTEEHIRAKQFLNQNGFNCTTAPWIIIRDYRNAIKEHLKILQMNLDNENGYVKDMSNMND